MIRLRPYKSCDAKYIVSWMKDEISFRKWCADRYEHYPITGEDMNQYYDQFKEDDILYQMTAFDETGIVGHLTMRFTDEDKQILRFGFVIVDDNKRRKGYGKEMLSLALKYAFEILKVQKVTLGVFENNLPAIYCYQSVSFVQVPAMETESYSIMGEQWDCIEMEITSVEKCHNKDL